jgi:hypothetical protein
MSWNTPDFYRSLMGLNIIGLPAGYVAIRGEYPLWGRDAGAFRCSNDPS